MGAAGIGGTWVLLAYKLNELIRHVKETNGTLLHHSSQIADQAHINDRVRRDLDRLQGQFNRTGPGSDGYPKT